MRFAARVLSTVGGAAGAAATRPAGPGSGTCIESGARPEIDAGLRPSGISFILLLCSLSLFA
jgi:hypothetical protein